MSNPILEARAHVQRDRYVDGLTEIAAGILQLLLAGQIFLTTALHGSSAWLLPLLSLFLLAFGAFALFQQRVVRAIRVRIAYSRTGYVSYREPGKRRRLVLVALTALLAIVVGVLGFWFRGRSTAWSPDHWLRALPALVGIVSSAAMITFAIRTGLTRFLLVAALSSTLGLAISYAWPDPKLGLSVFLACLGCILLISGGITLWRYRRLPRVPSEEV
jgi:hypothetical protein